jgi:hypothetical protein
MTDVALRRDAQQLTGGVAEDRCPLGVAQARRAENVLHSRARPRIGIIGPHDDADTTLLTRQWHRCRDAGLSAMHRSGVALPPGIFD